jgi:hypothetical protein
MEQSIDKNVEVRLKGRDFELTGRTRYCVFRDGANFIGVHFDAQAVWNEEIFRPEHMLDPEELLSKAPPSAHKPAPPKRSATGLRKGPVPVPAPVPEPGRSPRKAPLKPSPHGQDTAPPEVSDSRKLVQTHSLLELCGKMKPSQDNKKH